MLEASIIRAVAFDDLPMVLAWRNHPEVRRYMFTQHEISLEEHCDWFARVSSDPSRRLFIVEESREPIGYVQFNSVSPGGVADWGFYVRPDAPKGSGRKLGVTALQHVFESLKLHKVCGQAIESNQASIKFHSRLGFRLEGVLREQQRIKDNYHTLYCYGLLAHEWQSEPSSQEK
jgi:UDP-4-amino-4,6-dideoxy-N-acetyl-beta-L-altrosamine N-acetyltransferase